MTAAELAKHDGKDGRQAYIAVNGTVYDVTDSPHWVNGLHPPDHHAGKDLSDELKSAPHVRAVVERFPVVGRLEEEPSMTESGGSGKKTAFIVIGAVIVAFIIIWLL